MPNVSKERKFDVKTLRKHCQELFDTNEATFDGAFYSQTKNEFTKAEASRIISTWKSKEVS